MKIIGWRLTMQCNLTFKRKRSLRSVLSTGSFKIKLRCQGRFMKTVPQCDRRNGILCINSLTPSDKWIDSIGARINFPECYQSLEFYSYCQHKHSLIIDFHYLMHSVFSTVLQIFLCRSLLCIISFIMLISYQFILFYMKLTFHFVGFVITNFPVLLWLVSFQ